MAGRPSYTFKGTVPLGRPHQLKDLAKAGSGNYAKLAFYRTILKEIPTPKGPDEEYDQMIEACIKWQPSRTQLLLYGDRVEENADRNSETILGIKLVLMKKLCKHAELRCLRMILSLLEATTDSVATTIETSLNQGKIH